MVTIVHIEIEHVWKIRKKLIIKEEWCEYFLPKKICAIEKFEFNYFYVPMLVLGFNSTETTRVEDRE